MEGKLSAMDKLLKNGGKIVQCNTESIFDVAKRKGTSVKEEFELAERNLKYFYWRNLWLVIKFIFRELKSRTS